MEQRRNIQIDPFYDGTDAGNRYGQPQPAQQASVPSGYAPVDRDMLNQMGGSRVRGTIIPHATIGGIPIGARPHATADVEVNVDPHIPGQSSRVRLGDLTPQNIQAATAIASDFTPEPTDTQTRRLRGAAIMHIVASRSSRGGIEQAVAAPTQPQYNPASYEITPDYQLGQPTQPRPIQPQPVQPQPLTPVRPQPMHQSPANGQSRRVSPLAAFDAPPFKTAQELQSAPAVSPPASTIGPPQIQVTFEMEHFGTLPAYYHDVVIGEGFLVLVYDTRHRGSAKYFPRVAADGGPRTAINVVGTPEVYLVQTTGIQYEHDAKEFCILMIESAGRMPPPGA